MDKVISFLMDDNKDIYSLNLRDSYDIYKTILEYPDFTDITIRNDLLFHIKELFPIYLKENDYTLYNYMHQMKSVDNLKFPKELFNLNKKEIDIDGLFTPQRKDELLYYSLLFKIMNITKVDIKYNYASDIPLEYICPSCIQDIFPSLEELKVIITTHYKKTNQLLNPNSDEYIMEYSRLYYSDEDKIKNSDDYEYYTESEMNEYNNMSSLDTNKLDYTSVLIDSYNERREENMLPKLYKYVVDEAIYKNDYSEIRKTAKHLDDYSQYNASIMAKALEEGVLDSSTTLSVFCIIYLTNKIDENLFNRIMTTHVFPNVTELIYDDDDLLFQLSSIKNECFPKLHIINYDIHIDVNNFESLFPKNLMSMIDTSHIDRIDSDQKNEITCLLNKLVYTHSIHIDGIVDFTDSENILKLDYFEKYNQNIDCIDITFEEEEEEENNNNNNEEHSDDKQPSKNDIRNSLSKFLKSSVLQHLNKLTVSFEEDSSINYLKWVSSLFDNNMFNTIHELTLNLFSIDEDTSSKYLNEYKNIIKKLIPKASNVIIHCNMTFINQLIQKEYFHNTNKLTINTNDIPNDFFFKLYTTDNFPQLKSIQFCCHFFTDFSSVFIQELCKYIHNNNFLSSTTIQLYENFSNDKYIYNPEVSIFRLKYDTNIFMDTIIGTNDKVMNKYEIETLFDYIYDEEQLSKLINFITLGKISQLKEIIIYISDKISSEHIDIYKNKLNYSSFIQENHVNYEFNLF
ncbi:hypothetical protein WA158_002586 [Blastocystis sp. Blastoise]